MIYGTSFIQVLILIGSYVGYLQTKLYLLKKERLEYERRLELALEGNRIGLWDWSTKYSVVQRNAGYGEMLGYSRKEISNHVIFQSELIHKNDVNRLKTAQSEYLRGDSEIYEVEYRLKTKSGKWKWVLDRGTAVSSDHKKHPSRITGITVDITKRKETERRIKNQSYTDTLTGLRNRAYFDKMLKKLDNERATPLSLIIGDLNGLKLTNDTFGHEVGDSLLVAMADVLRKSCRKKDIITRWGGDEFALLLPGTSEQDAVKICKRIHSMCKSTQSEPVQLSIALGAATRESLGEPLDALLKNAENWMYQHKLLESKSTSSSLINSIEETLNTKNPEIMAHSRRVRSLALKLGHALKLSSNNLDELSLLAVLHDIGKVNLPDNILLKELSLTEEENKLFKKHPETGYRIANSLPQLKPIANGIFAHHESWDGTGYPRNLSGDEIPLSARIICLANDFDNLIHGDNHKKPLPKKQALQEIKKLSGTKYDPKLVSLFLNKI